MSDPRPPRSADPRRTTSDGPRPLGEIIERLPLDRRSTPAPAPPRSQRDRLVTGRLKAHGRATYQFEPHGSSSYYVQIVSTRGIETLWGVDLERAMTQSKTQPKIGAMVGARRIGSERVTVPPREGGPKTEQARTFQRARWVVEEVTFFADAIRRARRDREVQLADSATLRERPELRSAYISLRVAQMFAEQNIQDPRDRALFVERVKAVMALSGKSSYEPRSSDREGVAVKPLLGREEPTR